MNITNIHTRHFCRLYLLFFALCLASAVTAQSKIYYVSPTAQGTGDGLSWANAMTLDSALTAAKANDQIWLQGFEQITGADQLYVTPTTAGFSLKSGVQLYGGFKGDEASIDDRETLGKPYQLKYRSVLSGDINKDDAVDNTNLIYPANTNRTDNATHVLSLDMDPAQSGNNNTYPTVVNGLTIAGGHAGTDEKGGGIYVHRKNTDGGNYRIERCFFYNNYATLGGAIYVDAAVQNVNNGESLVSQCVIYNNAAGGRSDLTNDGGGIYLAGDGTVVNCAVFNNENGGLRLSANAKVVNSTIARNTGGGIDMINAPATGNVFNTAVWGNSSVYSQNIPIFQYSAYTGATEGDANNNLNLNGYNYENDQSPCFEAPSSRTGFDRDFKWNTTAYPLWSWAIQGNSYLVDKGKNEYYSETTYGSFDINGKTRISGPAISIGAHEYQYLPATRIRYVKQGGTGDGTSWANASGNLQQMINNLADNNPQNMPGEVWVAAGTYAPQSQVLSGTTYSASFRMRDGISVYGGFAGTETSKQKRAKGDMPWEFTNRTILQSSYYGFNSDWNQTYNKWTLNSDSRHVVWFAPLLSEGKNSFDQITTLNGVTIQGGYAQGGDGIDDFLTDRGAGVYMGINAYLDECVVTENTATGNGGGVYLNGGRVLNSLVYNNNADGNGGGIYVDNAGIVLASMVSNNSANNGAGVYLAHTGAWSDGKEHPEYLILSTSVISNNTSRQNGAIYCDRGGIVQQSTIVNNYCPTATDNTTTNASQTGGLYINEYALVFNSVIWNNLIQMSNVPMYAKNPTAEKVRFLYNGVSGINNAVWNYTLQQEMISLSEENNSTTEGVIDPEFDTPGTATNITAGNIQTTVGVQSGWKLAADGTTEGIDFYWEPVIGSNLRARGMTLGGLPSEVLMAPELDIANELFAQKPALGAFNVDATQIQPQETNDALIIYIDADCTDPTHDGSSWNKAYRSLNEALSYFAELDTDIVGTKRLEIHVLEGDLWPRYAYTNLDPKTATVDIPVMASGQTVEIYGGYRRDATDATNNTVLPRSPLTYRSIINGNHEGKVITDGLYHCITVAAGAKVVIDGFHVINGYAAGEASRQYGAGLLVHDKAEVTLNNCIFENNTAVEGTAIDARDATLTLNNCVVNNNTNTLTDAAVVNCPNLTMNHVTVVNNIGAAPANMGNSSFSAGNSENNTHDALASAGEAGAKNFTNPTNKPGATLGFDTYLGGYSEFKPQTSSTDAANLINKATGTPAEITTDIAGNPRDLGGVPDLGAYEAILPENGTVFYVTENGAGNMDGTSWENAIAGNSVYDVNNSQKIDNLTTSSTSYAGFYNQTTCPYGEKSGASKLFFDYLDDGDLNQANVSFSYDWRGNINGITGIDIKNERNEQYVSGLQYAVEKAAEKAKTQSENIQVWVAGGTYTDWKGFVIRDKVHVMGGFPNAGSPGEDDRHPLLSTYISVNEKDKDLDKSKYETIIQVRDSKPYVDNNGSYSSVTGLPPRMRKPVLFQPDVCLPTKSPSGRESYSHVGNDDRTNYINLGGDDLSNTYRYNLQEGDRNGEYVEYTDAMWDGFTIRYGFYTDYSANRDGGAGVRMFRGVTLQNCVVADNFINGYNGDASAGMGAGIYCDGDNSQIVNCFVLNNVNLNPNSAGGGANLMVGTSYNCVFANNYSQKDGGGVFMENAYFYNNTVANNKANNLGGGIHQWTRDGATMKLVLYNTILYGNKGAAITSGNIDKFEGAFYCYIQSETELDNKIRTNAAGWNTQYGVGNNLLSPFEAGSYRLSSSSSCINRGTEVLENGTIELPETDVDFTDRIKDCAVDIGAYESDNETNIGYETVTEADGTSYIYYVTQNGAGLRSGNSAGNAACAMKLQQILTAAGTTATTITDGQVYVRIAGYEQDTNPFIYHANTLSNSNDPQSYTYVVPEGIIVEGGYTKDFVTRNPKQYKTILSAVANTAAQNVTGYHVVTFKPASVTSNPTGEVSLTKTTIIDGLYLQDGSATSMAGTGNPNTRGGGAIVPSGAHVRNCVVMNCEAIEGGGLYLLPGATVSGTAILENSAENGGGVYADNTDANNTSVTADTRAHILSCTIANNKASSTGGGLYMEEGAVMNVNTVIFDNRASSDKNVSGVVSQQFEDTKLAAVFNNTNQTSFYPFNDCFVETQEMPSDFENTELKSDKSLYFADDYYRLKDYSLLIKHGVKNDYQTALVATFNVATRDMQDIDRIQTDNAAERLDAGAFAYEGGILPTDLFTRIFVSQATNVTLDGENMIDYLGRSFYTSFSTLEDALGYIRSMREKGTANDATKFEILVAGGTYKPSYLRTTGATVDQDQKLYSFVVPQGVSIYGGFVGTEKYSSSSDSDTDGFTNIGSEVTGLVVDGKITEILADRKYSDFNQNNILEPWELANQTILSGQIDVSSTAQKAYHVVFTDKGTATTINPIVLDGLTVMNGQTDNALSVAPIDEKGRGGGIYSNGVTYTISRCRLLNNTAVRGGAVFVRDADLNLSGCILAGNKTVVNTATGQTTTLTSRGGAAYVSGIDQDVNLRAVNTLWANNESAGEGGAIGTNYAEGISSSHDPLLCILNNTFVRNKADKNPVLYNHNAKSEFVNTLIWGNDGESYDDATSVAGIEVSHSASDVEYVGKFASGNNNNILLSKENMDDTGPRFTRPSTQSGVAGNDANSQWNPAAISVLTDAGDGTKHNDDIDNRDEGTEHMRGQTTGAYQDWFNASGYLGQNGVSEVYITKKNGTYSRYSGPRGQNNEELCKPIDIGVYEYQYELVLDTIYVIPPTPDQPSGDGSSWANATTDLRGALIAMANPTDGMTIYKAVYIRAGEYSWPKISAGTAFTVSMGSTDLVTSLTVKGSFDVSGKQDFSQPTIITTNTSNADETDVLMAIAANEQEVLIEGLTFINKNKNTNGGNGITANTATNGKLTLKNVAFRGNMANGLNINKNEGEILLVNTLFADGGTGLSGADSRTTVVNATFANNKTDYTSSTGTPAIYNSVAWKNDTQYLTTDPTNHNVSIAGTIANDDLENGPNFRDPNNTDIYSRDYSLRPSVKLLNKGDKNSYTAQVRIANFDDEKDLGDNKRLIDTEIDVGAYEYEAELQPIVYVKADLMVTADGKTWDTALDDLQGAVDLAGLYAQNHSTDTNPVHGYVFVHGNYKDKGTLNLTLKNTKVYGSMNDEQSTKTDTEEIVSDLLTKRKGMLEATERSSLENVTIDADGVIDGFEVTGTATISDGVLATSIVKNNVTTGDGLLYNSFVEGSVSIVQAVNVTATGTIADVTGSGNNRASVTDQDTNKYVIGDYWKYQLMETDNVNLDKGTNTTTQACIDKVGHERDLIGNKRIRNTVDNGCFETWNICDGMTQDTTITANDYPRGKSVVYVRKGKELKIENDATTGTDTLVYDEASAFTPGFLLLEHQAGLRGNGNFISLTNFAVERDIPADGADLVAMPFDVNTATSNLAGITPQRYNGSTRAAYTYKYDAANSTAWTDQNLDLAGMYEGLLFDNTTGADQTLRFYGKSTAPYIEDGKDKSISLQKYNFNEPWATPDAVSNKFTHKENMSWNLFGSPYLCAMNYSDLEYGRVLYGYNGGYKTAKTYNYDGTTVEGYIPAGNAVFTQSATLKDRETFSIAQPKGSKNGNPFQKSLNMAIFVDYTKTTASKATADYCSFNAVPASEASNSFDLGSDGVKWLADNGKPQIYAIRNGGRYSLLSAVNEEAETEIGLLLPEAGNYVIGIGEGSERQEYEAVILIDRLNGTTTDLLDKDYTFSASEGGTLDDRFRITFNPEANSGLHGGPVVRIYPEGKVLVSGITDGEYVSAYNAAGMLIQRLPVTENHVWFKLQQGFYLFNIHYTNDTDKALKAIVP